MTRFLVLLETSGNQRYIFATNKLRENVGASELTYRAGRSWVWNAVHPNVPEEQWNEADRSVNPPLGPGNPVQIILATSGKAYLLADSAKAAADVIRTVTVRSLKDAPGLDLTGVSVEVEGEKLHEAIQKAHKRLAARRGTSPGVEARFRRLPVVAECATSGLPANLYDSGSEPGPRSHVSLKKRDLKVIGAAFARANEIASRHTPHRLARSVDELDRVQKSDWLAVVHADGNGLGKVFLNFHAHADERSVDGYIHALQRFSRALDYCTEEAFAFALEQLAGRLQRKKQEKRDGLLPVVPIVLGGDDMTVVMDGRYAIQFTIDFLGEFERLTASNPLIGDIMEGPKKDGPDRVTACAGVAVVKPHFPFYAAYHLAEEFIGSAKKYAKGLNREKPPSALDFHILYDASGPDLERIRGALRLPEVNSVTELVARPYLVSDDATSPRTTAALATRMRAIQAEDDDGRPKIPNSQLHDLRAALFHGRAAAEARLNLIRPRYADDLQPLLIDRGELYREDGYLHRTGLFWKDGGVHRTALLDTIDLVGFWDEGSAK